MDPPPFLRQLPVSTEMMGTRDSDCELSKDYTDFSIPHLCQLAPPLKSLVSFLTFKSSIAYNSTSRTRSIFLTTDHQKSVGQPETLTPKGFHPYIPQRASA